MKVCKKCGEELSDLFFYKNRAVCKFCLKSPKMKRENYSDDLSDFCNPGEKNRISRVDKLMMILKDNGNVFINEKLDLDFIESKVGFKVKVRDCVGGGYVYERIKGN